MAAEAITVVISGQAPPSTSLPAHSVSHKINRPQLAIVLPLGYTALKLRAAEENSSDSWA